MQADAFSREADRGADGRLPAAHAAAAAVLIGLVGGLGTLQVWVLALAGGAVAWSIARRDGAEPGAPDRTATLLKLAFVAVLCGAAYDNRTQRFDFLDPSATDFLAFALIPAGLYLRRRALSALGRHFSIKVVLLSDHRLIDVGPYRTIRHPNYAGLVLVMLGTAIVLQSPFALGAVVLLWLPALWLRIRQEESALLAYLGDDYARYTRRTWRLVPGIY